MSYFCKDKPYIIAEISANHNNSINFVMDSIAACARAGASAVKTQLFTAGSIGIPDRDSSVVLSDPSSPWNGYLLYDLYESASMPYEWYPTLIKATEAHSIDLIASVFDLESLEYLLRLDLPIVKVSSFEIIHIPLLQAISSCQKPVILSTGMASDSEVSDAVKILGTSDAANLCLLECISAYPANPENYSIKRMLKRKHLHNVEVGISDHTLSNIASILAVSHGAVVVEKHFLLDKSVKTLDSSFSIGPDELRRLVHDCNLSLKISRNDPSSYALPQEKSSAWERPSLYYANDLSAGHPLAECDLLVRRPSLGLSPAKLSEIVGKRLLTDVKRYSPVKNGTYNE